MCAPSQFRTCPVPHTVPQPPQLRSSRWKLATATHPAPHRTCLKSCNLCVDYPKSASAADGVAILALRHPGLVPRVPYAPSIGTLSCDMLSPPAIVCHRPDRSRSIGKGAPQHCVHNLPCPWGRRTCRCGTWRHLCTCCYRLRNACHCPSTGSHSRRLPVQ